jgi:hypothetical protein
MNDARGRYRHELLIEISEEAVARVSRIHPVSPAPADPVEFDSAADVAARPDDLIVKDRTEFRLEELELIRDLEA